MYLDLLLLLESHTARELRKVMSMKLFFFLSPDSTVSPQSSQSSWGIIVGVMLPVAVVLIAVIAILLCLCKFHKRIKGCRYKETYLLRAFTTYHVLCGSGPIIGINMSEPNVNVQCLSSQPYTTLFKCQCEH